MTETASNKSKMYFDFDSYKNQEWLRRRKLRIEQVRKQSSQIAKMLRQKALNEEQVRSHEVKKIEETKFRFWKAEKLDEMERKLRCALEEFGLGYKLAESEPEPGEIIQVKNTVNTLRAQERGEIAMEEELKRKKLEEKEKNYPIERKKMTRKLENLRSALICSVSNRKDFVNLRRQKKEIICLPNHQEGDTVKQKITVIREKDISQVKSQESSDINKKVAVQKTCRKSQLSDDKLNLEIRKNCNNRNRISETEVSSLPVPNSSWINLDSFKIPLSSKSSRMTSNRTKSEKLNKEKNNCTIEFYDHPSRYYYKSLRDYSNLVEKINPKFEYDAVEVAEKEELNKNLGAKKKNELNVISQERGNRALRREKINRECNYMMEKLGELQKKEKVLKAQQRVPSDFIYMTDERLSERMKTKQRIMESKFENIYHEATSGIISQEPHRDDIGNEIVNIDLTHLGKEPTAKLSFSPGNIKTTSPVSRPGSPGTSLDVSLDSPIKVSSSARIRRSRSRKSKKKKKKLLREIDRTLEEGRKLRKRIIENRENFQPSLEESSDVEEKGSKCLNNLEPSPRDSGRRKSVSCQDRESQTDELKTNDVVVDKGVDLKPIYVNIGTKTDDISLPLSTSTSYKSPPSTVRSYRLRKFLDYLESLDEIEEDQNDSTIKGKMQKLLDDLLNETNFHSEESNLRRPCKHGSLNRNLEYYVLKLLNMSRECIANLSVSTLNASSPTIIDVREEEGNENLYCNSNELFKALNSEENFKIRRGEEQNKLINNWTSILEHNFVNLRQTPSIYHRSSMIHPSLEKLHTFEQCEVFRKGEISESESKEKCLSVEEGKAAEDFSSSSESKYEKITQKCSERILELSNMLEKVRRDKEKLLYSNSGGPNLKLRNDRIDDPDLPVKEQQMFNIGPSLGKNIGGGDHLNFTVLETFIDRYNLSRKNIGSTAEKEDSQSFRNPKESMTSLESLPDVMSELLEKEIITSPFKWSDGEPSPEATLIDEIGWKPSSIESVVNNFRKEMSRVKSLSLVSSGTVPRLSSLIDEAPDDVPDLETNESISFDRNEINDSNRFFFNEESSVESINHALTRLGLNWAKSILKKNEESKAMSSSSSSDSGSTERKSSN